MLLETKKRSLSQTLDVNVISGNTTITEAVDPGELKGSYLLDFAFDIIRFNKEDEVKVIAALIDRYLTVDQKEDLMNTAF